MSGQFEFRGLLLKIQDLLSDHDRQRLHFLLGDDVPRNLRDDPSLGGTLSVLQSLFDKDIINAQDCNYLIEALTKIRCLDAAHRLRDYQRNQEQSDSNSLSLIDILARDLTDEDKMVTNRTFRRAVNEQCKDVSTQIELPSSSSRISSSWKKKICQTKLSCRECFFVTIIIMSLMSLILASRPWLKMKTDSVQPKIDQFVQPITNKLRWSSNGTSILGRNGFVSLNFPRGIAVRKDGMIYVADFDNNRIIEQNSNTTTIRIFEGDPSNPLNQPTDILIERDDETLIICDYGNRRLIRWFLSTNQTEQMNIAGDDCRGLTMDNRGYLYVSDGTKHEIRRYRIGEKTGKIVAGGHGQGNRMNQFAYPLYIAVDDEYSIYISDTDNQRVMKWKENAKEGVIVAGGFASGDDLDQLNHPLGIHVDPWKNIYVVDSLNKRVMRWRENMREGEIVVQDIRMHYPVGLDFDANWNMYVVDGHNHQVLKFDLLL